LGQSIGIKIFILASKL